jgi:recombinational DNA repair ATPase RecF
MTQILKNFTSDLKNNNFFKDFNWNNIPILSIITGLNGSGKTQLLKAIYIKLSQDVKTKNDVFFLKHNRQSNLFQKVFDRTEFNNSNDIYRTLISLKDNPESLINIKKTEDSENKNNIKLKIIIKIIMNPSLQSQPLKNI